MIYLHAVAIRTRGSNRKKVLRKFADLLEKIAGLAKTWTAGDPLDPATKVGSMIENPNMEKVLGYIAAGHREGAKLVMGGKRILIEDRVDAVGVSY